MASNFSIEAKKNGKVIHLDLAGDFDSASALELIFFMNNCFSNDEKVIINTDFLYLIEPLGINVFRYNIGWLANYRNRFVFTGETASVFSECWQTNVNSCNNLTLSIKDKSYFIH